VFSNGFSQLFTADSSIGDGRRRDDFWTNQGLHQTLSHHHFTPKDIVSCFDDRLRNNNNSNRVVDDEKWLHFAFIGDSRIRQHFYNFLKVSTTFYYSTN
jgi:hypothetical protein